MDRDFFPGGTLFEDALSTAVETSCPQPQSVEPQDHLGAPEIRSLNVFAEYLLSLQDWDDMTVFERRLLKARKRAT